MSVLKVISRAEMRVGVEHLAELRVSDEELAGRGVTLDTKDWIDGLGPHTFAFIEVEGGNQFALARSEWGPDDLQVWAQLDKDEQQLGVLVAALGVDRDRLTWVSPPGAAI
jgi:hypothetical protein